MDVNDEDDLFGPGEGDGEGGDAGTEGQDAAQEQPKDGGDDLGADGNQQEDPAGGDADKDQKVEGEGGEPKPEDKKEGQPEDGKSKDDKDEKYVPKAALDSEKRRRRELNQRLKALEEREAERERAAAAAAAPRPGDPGYEEYRSQQATITAINQNLNRSEYDTRKEHGDEKVDEMMAWAQEQFQSRPDWAKQVFGHPHPYDFAMKEYEAAQAAQGPKDHGDPEYAAFLAWKQSQGQGGNPQAAAPSSGAGTQNPPPVEKAPPPISLAQRHSASSGTPPAAGSKDAFDQEFG